MVDHFQISFPYGATLARIFFSTKHGEKRLDESGGGRGGGGGDGGDGGGSDDGRFSANGLYPKHFVRHGSLENPLRM